MKCNLHEKEIRWGSTMIISVDETSKTLQIGAMLFTSEELTKLLVPNDNGSDDALILWGRNEEIKKDYCISVKLSCAGKDYFEKYPGELEVNNYIGSVYITLWIPFKNYYNIIRQYSVQYLLNVIKKSNKVIND